MEIMYKPFPSKINVGLWNVAKRQFIIKKEVTGNLFLTKVFHFKTKKEAQTEPTSPTWNIEKVKNYV